MKVCQFVVPGEPVAKGRPRFARQGQYVRTYTPKKTEDYEKFVQLCWRRQSGVVFPKRTALAVKIRAYFKIPKSISNRKRAEMIGKPHIKKADGDNIAKSILDSVNRVAFDDDSAIARLEVETLYDEIPRVEVYITEWQNEC